MGMISVRKLVLTIINEDEEKRKEQYKFIRDSQYAQYLGLNNAMGILSSAYLESGRNLKSDIFKNAKNGLKNSSPCFDNIEFGQGIDSKSSITQKVKKDFDSSIKNGLAKGERNFTNYKRTFPLMTRGRDLKFKYEDDGIYIKWVNKITFKVILKKHKANTEELEHTLHKIINGQYKVNQSSLEFDSNNKLILNLNFTMEDIPKTEYVEGRVLGVDMGIKYPIYMALNDNSYIKQSLGSIDDFLRVRQQMQKRYRELQKSLKLTKGGKGRKKKMKALVKFQEKERNWTKTYNHQLSAKVIQFAIANKCQYINLEKLTSDGFNDRLLRNWSYFELQQMIQYKAERVGIKVRFINPKYTSQTCHKCGYVSRDNRPTQEEFICQECGNKLNADLNASINIARSTKFMK